MLKRFIPLQVPNGIITKFFLPSTYIGGDATLFVNGQLLSTRNEISHFLGYILDEANKFIQFYSPLLSGDQIYIIYDSEGESTTGGSSGNIMGSGVMKLKTGYSLISYVGPIKSRWDKTQHKVVYPDKILANVLNLFIDQIEDRYGVQADTIIREIQTYDDDSQQYRTWTSSTGKAWTYNGEHIINDSLYRIAGDLDYGDPDFGNYVYFNPNAFILSSTYLDSSDVVISLDEDNNIQDLPMGLRRGIHIYVYPEADLSLTNNLLELWI